MDYNPNPKFKPLQFQHKFFEHEQSSFDYLYTLLERDIVLIIDGKNQLQADSGLPLGSILVMSPKNGKCSVGTVGMSKNTAIETERKKKVIKPQAVGKHAELNRA